jgi:hypothetical protein
MIPFSPKATKKIYQRDLERFFVQNIRTNLALDHFIRPYLWEQVIWSSILSDSEESGQHFSELPPAKAGGFLLPWLDPINPERRSQWARLFPHSKS